MFSKQDLIKTIEAYTPFDATECAHKESVLRLLSETDDCFLRNDFPGHIVGGAWLLSPDHTQVLLTHHGILKKWFQFGGHADGEINIAQVGLREAQEESGIEEIDFLMPEIFDIDVHDIPANPKKGEPAHTHYELRYAFSARHKNYTISDESSELRWFTLPELKDIDWDASRRRMIQKWENMLAQPQKRLHPTPL